MTQIALVLRSNDVYLHFNQPYYYNETYFDELLISTNVLQDKLQDELIQWAYCPSSQIINRKRLKFWDLDRLESQKADNLFKFVEFILKNVKFIQARSAHNNMKAGKNYDKELMNVIENVIGTSLGQVYEATDGLVECEVKRVRILFRVILMELKKSLIKI